MNFNGVEILICVGSGGVGKTTMAAALGVQAAKVGKNVLLLTIDPSKRLAQTLNLKSEEISLVPGQNFKGKLYAGLIEHKKIFDDFVKKAAGSEEKAQRIFKNKLYQELTGGLSGSQEFSSLEKLLSCAQSGNYDLIILDTPPTQHALDFLNAPTKLQALFNERVSQWFRAAQNTQQGGMFQQLLNVGTQQMIHVLESLTGKEFVSQLSEFFITIRDWQSRLEARTVEMHRLLLKPTTQFCLVTSFDAAKIKEAEYFRREIQKGGYHLNYVVLNRAAPTWVVTEGSVPQGSIVPELSDLRVQMLGYYGERDKKMNQFSAELGPEVRLLRIPDYMDTLSDMNGLELISKEFEK